MKRNWNLDEVSDGKRYTENDLAKVGVNDCQGCFSCCCDMGESIVLDPYDMHQLCSGLKQAPQEVLKQHLELNLVDGVILPNLKMEKENQRCGFLNEEGRCRIHDFRPGICRLFPLGRVYEENDFQYFLQVHECQKKERTKVKIAKWIALPELKRYHAFIKDWHYFLKAIQDHALELQESGQLKTITMFILNSFFLTAYEEVDFYNEFEQRLAQARQLLRL